MPGCSRDRARRRTWPARPGADATPPGLPYDGRMPAPPGDLEEFWMKVLELWYLAERAPTKIAIPRVPQIGGGDGLKAARRVEPRGHLMGQPRVLHESIVAGRLNGLLVQTHGVGVSPFEAGDLGRYQGVLIGESRWIVVGRLVQPFCVRRQEVAPPALLVGRAVLTEHRHRQRSVVKVVEQLDMGGRSPKDRLSLIDCRERLGVVACQESRLKFQDPVPSDRQAHPLPCQLRLEWRLVELRVAEGGEGRGPAQHRGDEALLAHEEG